MLNKLGRFAPKRASLRTAALFFAAAASLVVGCIAYAQSDSGAAGSEPSDAIAAEDSAACMACHSEAQGDIKAVDEKALAASTHKNLKCQYCHATITGAPHTPKMLEEKAECGNCHQDKGNLYMIGAHANEDKVAGDHPTCATCHGNGDAHAIKPPKTMTRAFKAELCSQCHRQTDRMKRYGVDTDAVTSYDESFHGKALLIYHADGVAVCTDCHETHSILPPKDPLAPTNRNNGNALCSQKACHPGANVNYAMSGSNHLRLKIKDDKILAGVDLFFRVLVGGVVLFLMGGVALDVRKKVFARKRPRSGRTVGLLISLSFLMAAATLGLAIMGHSAAATRTLLIAVGAVVAAYVFYFIRRRGNGHEESTEKYERLSTPQRWQHALLAICFTTLICTGLPLHFATVPWLQRLYEAIGGITVARPIHRVAAIGLICVWAWHLGELMIRWRKQRFAVKALTMLPNWKDVTDFIGASKWYFGLTKEEPKYDRFQFRQKLDYLAEYWGVPVMVISGFILWFPIYWGNRLPEEALSIAIVAHGWEATLAFLAIILWHMYNEHFNPDAFPMSKVWLTGTLTREEMEREHPVELGRILGETPAEPDSSGGPQAPTITRPPATEMPLPPAGGEAPAT